MALEIGFKGEELNLLIVQGADFGPILAIMTNPDGSPVDLTGCTIQGHLAKAPNIPAICSFSCVIRDASKGEYSFGLPRSLTTTIAAGKTEDSSESRYLWQLQLQDSTGRITPLYYGDANVFRGLLGEIM